MGKGTRLALCVFALFLVASKVALSQPSTTHVTPGVQQANTLDISIPSELGYILETHPAVLHTPVQPAPKTPLIIHIQEAHTNYEGQKHLVGILEQLIQRYGVRLILIEGGEGDVGLSYLRSYGPPENRRAVGEKYLKAGLINAEEYVDITSDQPLILWGVEQKALYDANVKAFLEVESLQQALKPTLTSVREAVETLAPTLYPPALKMLEDQTDAFQKERVALTEYTDDLADVAKQHSISLKSYPALARFLTARELEKTIHLDQVPREQTTLVKALSSHLAPAQLDELIVKAQEMVAGTRSREAFYAHLEQAAQASAVDLAPYPNLAGYIRYVNAVSQIRPADLSREMEQLAADLRKTLTSTPHSRALIEISEQVTLIEKLVNLKLSPEEYQRVAALSVHELIGHWNSFFQEQYRAQGLSWHAFKDLNQLETGWSMLQRFYETAHERDRALVDHAVAKLRASQEAVAVMITGGFHAPQVIQGLSEQGIGVVVIVPRVSRMTDDRLYQAVLKYKSGYGSREDVDAVLQRNTSSGKSSAEVAVPRSVQPQ